MRFTIFKRLTFDYIAIILSVIFLGGYITVKLNQLNELTRSIAEVDGATINHTENLLQTLYSQVSFEKKFIVSNDKDFYKRFQELKDYFLKHMEELRMLIPIDSWKKRGLFSEAEELYKEYLFLLKKDFAFVSGDNGERVQLDKDDKEREKEEIVDSINQRLRGIISIARIDRDKKIETSSSVSSHILRMAAIISGSSVVIGLLISFFNTRSINRSILLLQDKTKEIANGKFDKVTDITSPPEIKDLGDHFNSMCERLEELDDMKEDFISHISHELRTPLTAIKEASSMVLEETYASTNEKQNELFTIIKEECDRLINSVSRILDLSRMEANMMDYNFHECNLITVVQKSILRLAPIAQKKKINLELKPSSEIPLVKIDTARIEQVLENLLGNALKYTPDKGLVTININYMVSRKLVQVSVMDTGFGIAKNNLEKIFDKFKRINDGKDTILGTGLGLSIAKYIIDVHGGDIWVQSEPGKGSVFYFALPV